MLIDSGDQRILVMNDRTRVKVTKEKTPHSDSFKDESITIRNQISYGRWNTYERRE